ncbi:MAG: hypothetical protein KF709_07200 [Gemmatimonadaceae bacterium]|nr:hypothetical protein [Gemmatimonadaceae bacterium]
MVFRALLLASCLARSSASAQGIAAPRADTLQYETAALRALIEEAAAINRRVPEQLGGYRAQLESEVSIGNRRSEGMEMAVQLEQIASELTWDRSGAYTQVVTGYRSQSIGASFATLGFFRVGWAIPSLYGNRLALLFGRDTSEAVRRRRDRRGGDPMYAVHPLADDRDGFYRYSGGDTVVTMHVDGRQIPIVRVGVTLRDDVPDRTVVFVGELDLDASRRQLVRLRGHFAVVGGPKPKFDLLREARLQGVAYVEAVNAEIDGSFWLPAYQRFEAHATSNLVGEGRAIFRIITRYRDREFLPPPEGVLVGSASDTLAVKPFRLRVLPADTVSAYRDWQSELGAATADVSAEDFNDIAPRAWRADGPPRFSVETERLLDVMRADRIQGVFTGVGTVYRFRDAAPGWTFRTAAGYAWHERTARGRAVMEYRRGRTTTALRAVRSLDLTNDFRNPYDSGSTIAALLGSDDYDYVDRRSLQLQLVRRLGMANAGNLRLESGFVQDAAPAQHWDESPIGWGGPFRANRALQSGRYYRNAAILEWSPDVTLEFLRTGLGLRFSYERADGALSYQRAEGRFTWRTNAGKFAFGSRLDVGITNPDAPPQQLFELGANQNLPGYGYKEFAGDQAAVLRGQAFYGFGVLGAPIRLTPRLWLPPAAPGLALGVQAGYTRASTADALATVQALGSESTGHVRSSVALTLRIFGQSLGVGVARPLDYPEGWRWVFEFGQRF